MDNEREPIIQIILVFSILVILGNLLLLDWVYLTKMTSEKRVAEQKPKEKTTTLSLEKLGVGGEGPVEVTLSEEDEFRLLNACRTEVSQAIATISGEGKEIKEVVKEVVVPTVSTASKEYYVPLGTGEVTESMDWVEITGAQADINSGSYGRIKEVYFQANLRMPSGTGRVYAMLYNITDKHPVWNSEVSSISTTGENVSAKINLDEGSKLYKLKMKLSIPHKGNCDLARVKIVTY